MTLRVKNSTLARCLDSEIYELLNGCILFFFRRPVVKKHVAGLGHLENSLQVAVCSLKKAFHLAVSVGKGKDQVSGEIIWPQASKSLEQGAIF
jgi:hypothetical protein